MASFGENLRRERELRGIDLRDVAEATKISIRFLQALEQDRVHVLPGGIFRRAFVRQYAKHVGLDPERLVAEFVYAFENETIDKPAAPAPSAKPASNRGPLLLVALLLLGGLVSLLRSGGARATRDVVAPAPAPVSQPTDRVYPPPNSQPAQAQTTPEALVLTLSARQSCWVSAQVDGQPVLNRVLGEGETQTIEAAGEIILSVGNAGGLTFRVNDRAGMPLGRSGEVRRNIVITRQSLPALVEDAAPIRTSHSS